MIQFNILIRTVFNIFYIKSTVKNENLIKSHFKFCL